MDDVFIQNYFSDPGLSFQYFGSSLGPMRIFPGEKYYRSRRYGFIFGLTRCSPSVDRLDEDRWLKIALSTGKPVVEISRRYEILECEAGESKN